MAAILLPLGYALLVWWASTGIALWVVGLTGERPRGTLLGAALLLAGSLAALAATAGDATVAGAYAAFTAAILVWGAQEIAFLTGWITGPRRAPCPAGATGWARTGYAVQAVIWHELALAASGLAVVAATWGGANQVGAWTYGILFAMRISAKLNVFLGVPNLTENFLPAHLRYLKSYFGRAPMNGLFPVSVTASTVALVILARGAGAADPFEAAASILLATLVALALLEHWFLVLPLPVEALWAWGLASRDRREAAEAGADSPMVGGATIVRLDARLAQRAAAAAPGTDNRPSFMRAAPDARGVAGSDGGRG